MNVCFLAGTLGRGGAERQLVFMLRALKREGLSPRVLCLTRGEAFEKEIQELGIEVDWIGASPGRFSRLSRVISSLRRYNVEIIQSAHFYTNIYAAVAGRFLGVRNIGAIRSDLNSEISADRVFGKWQFRLPQHLVTNSEVALSRAFAAGISQNSIDIVRNIVELPEKNGTFAADPGKRLNILFAGRLGREKRPQVFVQAACRLLGMFPDVDLSFEIAGDGPLRAELEELCDDSCVPPDKIRFSGEQIDMAPTYKRSNILVLTSAYEGTPNVILEAMSYGIPVVATRVGGVPEILNDKTGILVDPDDLGGLVDATAKLIRNPNLRKQLGQQGRENVSKRHSFRYLQARLIGIYEKLLNCRVKTL